MKVGGRRQLIIPPDLAKSLLVKEMLRWSGRHRIDVVTAN
jgi:hypothetical protein